MSNPSDKWMTPEEFREHMRKTEKAFFPAAIILFGLAMAFVHFVLGPQA